MMVMIINMITKKIKKICPVASQPVKVMHCNEEDKAVVQNVGTMRRVIRIT
jgi:hypothetical protein